MSLKTELQYLSKEKAITSRPTRDKEVIAIVRVQTGHRVGLDARRLASSVDRSGAARSRQKKPLELGSQVCRST